LNRNELKNMALWLAKPNRKPLILRGARQVGKSTLVTLFANQQQRPLAVVNLERHPGLGSVFASNNPAAIIDTLEALPGMPPITNNTLLFLDEIQAVPAALAALRYFYEELPNQPVLGAGSLLEFALGNQQFSMPVGRVEYLDMGPMTFSEFLAALDENKLVQLLANWESGQAINDVIHARLLELLRLYYLIGGMPEAVKHYADTRSLSGVSAIHSALIHTYRDDFPKYIGNRSLARIQHVFDYTARSVGNKVKYSQYSSDDKSATIKADIELLCAARVVSKVRHSHCNGLPLQAELDEKNYKLLFLDIGLMNALCGLGWQQLGALQGAQLVNEGALAEQFIGQHLQALLAQSPNRELNYWLREGRANNAELDYVVAMHGQLVPIEVKAGASGHLKSLMQFMLEKQQQNAIRFDAAPPSVQTIEAMVRSGQGMESVKFQLHSLPLYLVEAVPRVIASFAVTASLH
jgi:uncharacterized protein